MFTSENDFFHTSSLASTVRNSDFDNHFLVIRKFDDCHFFFPLLNISETDVHHIFNRRGSMSSVPWLYGTNVLKQINDSFYNYIAHSEIPFIETCSIEKPVNWFSLQIIWMVSMIWAFTERYLRIAYD